MRLTSFNPARTELCNCILHTYNAFAACVKLPKTLNPTQEFKPERFDLACHDDASRTRTATAHCCCYCYYCCYCCYCCSCCSCCSCCCPYYYFNDDGRRLLPVFVRSGQNLLYGLSGQQPEEYELQGNLVFSFGAVHHRANSETLTDVLHNPSKVQKSETTVRCLGFCVSGLGGSM